MDFFYDLKTLTTVLCCLGMIILLVVSPGFRGKAWLLSFLIVFSLSYLGMSIPGILAYRKYISTDAYLAITQYSAPITALLWMLSWVLLLIFVITITSTGKSDTVKSTSEMPRLLAKIGGVAFFAFTFLYSQMLNPMFGLISLGVYVISAVIVGLLAARKNRDGWAWGLLGGNFLLLSLGCLMFLPFICPRCRADLSNDQWAQRECPGCDDMYAV